ncbi:MAG: hypothetical protein ACK4HF_14055 [Paracoccaceae bacterium]
MDMACMVRFTLRNLRLFARFLAILVPGLGASPVVAQDLLGSYYAEIAPQDRQNSSGMTLTNAGDILQQDRANVHRFGVRQPGDQVDRFFASQDQRSRLPTLFASGSINPATLSMILEPAVGSVQLLILVCGRNDRIAYLAVGPAEAAVPLNC